MTQKERSCDAGELLDTTVGTRFMSFVDRILGLSCPESALLNSRPEVCPSRLQYRELKPIPCEISSEEPSGIFDALNVKC